ncbi:hypothetical protein D3C76_1222250 [compost metagenome]
MMSASSEASFCEKAPTIRICPFVMTAWTNGSVSSSPSSSNRICRFSRRVDISLSLSGFFSVTRTPGWPNSSRTASVSPSTKSSPRSSSEPSGPTTVSSAGLPSSSLICCSSVTPGRRTRIRFVPSVQISGSEVPSALTLFSRLAAVCRRLSGVITPPGLSG